ncbi:Putative ribosomal protein S17/S11 [Septoria linicola]|uniref:Ribosomal protein S17/S11 n=1 Tax=Septoria linicola TaxID=215465 RepID=A0A9Q9B2J2_9PEZI|nr:putative ribosomal protein S17/S11 [Septoria linicola]USW56383.1 Putative ribosomal protein S17/S11 [Septoria linicola]
MSQRALNTSVRTLAAKIAKPQWICQRCLATQSQPAGKTDYRKLAPAELLSKPLPQARIPDHYLQHVNAETLPIGEQEQWEKVTPHKKTVGVVVSHGKMDKTVRVRVAGQRWNTSIKKYYRADQNHLVHDPNNSLLTGDVVELHRLRVSTQIQHVVSKIVSPFGSSIESRPPIPSPEERLAAYKQKRFVKLERRDLRRQAADGVEDAIQRLREMGLDPGAGAKAGVGRRENVPRLLRAERTPKSGAVLGEKGQKLPEGVLPGGLHETGKVNDRSSHNAQKAAKFEGKAKENLVEADIKTDELARKDLASDSALR